MNKTALENQFDKVKAYYEIWLLSEVKSVYEENIIGKYYRDVSEWCRE